MSSVIHVDFTPKFREAIAASVKFYGHKFVEMDLIENAKLHPSFVKGLIRSIMRKEGW